MLFDFVGTLAHLSEPVGITYARLARSFGGDSRPDVLQNAFEKSLAAMPPMVFADQTARQVADSERDWWRDLVDRTFQADATESHFDDFEGFFDQLFRFYASPAAWRIVPEALEVLRVLRRGGLRTGVLSNFDHRLPPLLDALRLRPLLDVVVLPAQAGAAKPDGRIFAVALERLGLPATQVLYVGDDPEQDIAGAEAAGMSAAHASQLGSLRGLVEVR